MPSAYDAVIIGAGLSGLSLAAHLASGPWSDRSVLLVDEGRYDIRASTWALWTTDPGWLAPAVSGSWRHFAVHADGTSRTLPLDPYRYLAVSGARLHDTVRERVDRAPRFEVAAGTVARVDDRPDAVRVTIDGADVIARWAFDSRPSRVERDEPSMAFLGWELDAEYDAFDPAMVTFMDFRVRRPGRLAFCYVLPSTTRHALVEIAEFRWDAVAPDLASDLAEDLTHYLRRFCGLSNWTVSRTEAGTLPLHGERVRRTHGRVVPIGTRGGMLKPSTGFALDRIQRHSRALAAALAAHDDPRTYRHGRRRDPWMDALFLDVLRRDPDLAETIFARLFARNPAPAVLRFLDEEATWPEIVRLIATLPAVPFLRSGLARVGRSTRP